MKLHSMKALSGLSKFSGCYNYYKDLIKAHDLKWIVDNDDVIISRLNRYHNNGSKNELFDWIKTIKNKIPEFDFFMDFILATGMRFNEAIKSYNLIIKIKHENRLEEYYNREEQTLEHFRFKQGRVSSNVFMRNYFNPTWIIDLKKRALTYANELL